MGRGNFTAVKFKNVRSRVLVHVAMLKSYAVNYSREILMYIRDAYAYNI